jgi:acetolactate synthase-1/2/3 large subunit
VDLALGGSVEAALDGLAERLAADRDESARVERRSTLGAASVNRRAERVRKAQAVSSQTPLHLDWVSHVLATRLPDDAILVEETLTARTSIQRAFERLRPGSFFAGAIGGLGTGLGTALGVKVAAPDRLVVCCIGDGSFHYDPALAAFGAMQELGLPMLVVIYDNGGYLSQERTIPRYFPDGLARHDTAAAGMAIQPIPDYPAIARAYGGWGRVVTDPAVLADAIDAAMEQVAAGRLALLDLRLAPVVPDRTGDPG